MLVQKTYSLIKRDSFQKEWVQTLIILSNIAICGETITSKSNHTVTSIRNHLKDHLTQ